MTVLEQEESASGKPKELAVEVLSNKLQEIARTLAQARSRKDAALCVAPCAQSEKPARAIFGWRRSRVAILSNRLF